MRPYSVHTLSTLSGLKSGCEPKKCAPTDDDDKATLFTGPISQSHRTQSKAPPPAGSIVVGSVGIMGPILLDPSKAEEVMVPMLKAVGLHGFEKVADKIVLGAVVLGTLNMGGLYLQRPRPPPPPVQPPPPTSTPPVTRHRPRFPTMEETISLADGPSDRSESSVIPRIPPSQV